MSLARRAGMNVGHVACAALVMLSASAAACSSSTDSPATSSSPTTPPDATPDAGNVADASDAAAPAPPLAPQVVSAGGPVLKTPRIVLATFGAEELTPQLETFAKGIGATTYWRAVTSEYGVGPAAYARTVNVAEAAPTTIAQQAIETWLVGQLDGTHPEWGTPDASAIYTIVYPKGTTVTVQGVDACASSPAWHGEVRVKGAGISVPYAVITRCDPFLGLDGIDFVTAGLSHEWLEAATNPFYASNPAFNGAAGEDSDWIIATGGELGDMCATTPSVYFKPDDFPFTVQRSWSNASAAAGHDPCVPLRAEPYFSAVPAVLEKVATGGAIDNDKSRGVVVPAGGSRTVDITLFSDGPTKGPWTVKAVDYAPRFGAAKDLSFAWSKSEGSAGETLQLTITRVKKDDALGGAGLFQIVSTLGARQSIWVVAVGDKAK